MNYNEMYAEILDEMTMDQMANDDIIEDEFNDYMASHFRDPRSAFTPALFREWLHIHYPDVWSDLVNMAAKEAKQYR